MAKRTVKKIPETKLGKVKNAWDGLSTSTQRIATFIGNLTVIVGLLSGTIVAIRQSVDHIIHEVADPIAISSEEGTKENRLAIQRVELILLMEHYPDNVVDIEATAEEYFSNDGNHYMMTLYSRWCNEHSPDSCHIMIKAKENKK